MRVEKLVLIQSRQIFPKKFPNSRQQTLESLVGSRDPKVNVLRETMVAIKINGKTTHQQVLNFGAVQARQKFAKLGR